MNIHLKKKLDQFKADRVKKDLLRELSNDPSFEEKLFQCVFNESPYT